MPRRLILTVAVLVVATIQPAVAAWPERPVQVIVPWPAGGTIDVMARPLAERFGEIFGQSLVVVPRDGAAGVIGTAAIANARPDGYTLGFNTTGPLTVQPRLVKDIPYRLEQFAMICQTFTAPLGLAVVPESPLRTLKDAIEAAKTKPGQVSYGIPGVGTVLHLATAQLGKLAGVDLLSVPYRGDPAIIVALKSGEVQLGALNAGNAMAQGLRVLTLYMDQRLPEMPDVPTATESGFPVVAETYGGLMAPANTPPDILKRLEAACEEAVRTPRYEQVLRSSQQIRVFRPAAAFRDKVARDFTTMREMVASAGIGAK